MSVESLLTARFTPDYNPLTHWGMESTPKFTPTLQPQNLYPESIYSIVKRHLTQGSTNPLPQYVRAEPIVFGDLNCREAEQFRVMGPTDIETIDEAQTLGIDNLIDDPTPLLPTRSQALAAIAGGAGHDLINFYTQALSHINNHENFLPFFTKIPDIKPYESELIDIVISGVLAKSKTVPLPHLSQFIHDVWRKLRGYYVFQKIPPNSKSPTPLANGSIYPDTWVESVWNSKKQKHFEAALIDLYGKHIQNYLDTPLFPKEGECLISESELPLETDPRWKLEIKKLIITHTWLGPHQIQWKGESDSTISNHINGRGFYVVIDYKFGNPLELLEPKNKIQALIYSHGVSQRQFAKKDFQFVRPTNVMFLYCVVDIAQGQIYYIDATVRPDEYQALMEQTYDYTKIWASKYEQFWKLRKLRRGAMISPHLPSADYFQRFKAA